MKHFKIVSSDRLSYGYMNGVAIIQQVWLWQDYFSQVSSNKYMYLNKSCVVLYAQDLGYLNLSHGINQEQCFCTIHLRIHSLAHSKKKLKREVDCGYCELSSSKSFSSFRFMCLCQILLRIFSFAYINSSSIHILVPPRDHF